MNRNVCTLTKLLFLISPLLLMFEMNAQTDQWIDKNENENYVARHECSFVQAGDTFIMFGGREKAKQLDVYDFKSDRWTSGGMAPKEFNHFQATFYEGFVWVIGSFKTNNFPTELPADHIWLYFPPTQTWIEGPEIPKDRRRGGAGLAIYNDIFYLVGGNTRGHDGGYVNWLDAYNPQLNTWTTLQDAPNARDHFSAVVLNDKLYAPTGRHSGGPGGVFAPLVDAVDVYDFQNKSWSSLKVPIPTPRAGAGVAVFNNELLVMGGEGETQGPAYKLVEVYNFDSQTWQRKADMHYARHGTQAIVCGKGIYIAGGSPVRGGGRQHHMEVYSEDSPSGKKVIASTLNPPKKVCIKTSSKKTISAKNKGGNTGSFINSISIIGKGKNNFKLSANHNLTLLKLNDVLQLEIEHLGDNASDKAELQILYNGSENITIPITTE